MWGWGWTECIYWNDPRDFQWSVNPLKTGSWQPVEDYGKYPFRFRDIFLGIQLAIMVRLHFGKIATCMSVDHQASLLWCHEAARCLNQTTGVGTSIPQADLGKRYIPCGTSLKHGRSWWQVADSVPAHLQALRWSAECVCKIKLILSIIKSGIHMNHYHRLGVRSFGQCWLAWNSSNQQRS